MKNSFWAAVGIPFKIKSIEKKTLIDAVGVAYDGNEYHFYGDGWFIDVKDRFRIFRFNDTVFIAKETSDKKADSEIANSKKAHDKLDGKVVGTKTIRIVVPKKITLFSDSERYFLVSKYLGSNMNESVYTNTTSHMSLKDCLSIVKLLLENGIAYKGYLPRNIVEEEDAIYLFDWEDASFTGSPAFDSFDHLWRTNFLLNWSYLFDYDDLDKGLKEFVGIQTPLSEPSLIEYENTFKGITNNKTSNYSLRNNIDKIVFGSELPLTEITDHFYIRQNDMGCLIADIFSSEIDVLYDILSYVFRKRDEHKFSYHVQVMTHLLIVYYNAALIQNHPPELPLQYYALIPILMMIDEYISEESYRDILSVDTLHKLMIKIAQISKDQSITGLYLSEGTEDLPRLLNTMLRDRIMEACPKTEAENIENTDRIITFILHESTQAHTRD